MKDILLNIIRSIAENPDDIKIAEEEQDGGLINFTINVNKDDMGKIIGKNGKVIKAIRTVMKIPAMKNGKKIFISLSDNPQQ